VQKGKQKWGEERKKKTKNQRERPLEVQSLSSAAPRPAPEETVTPEHAYQLMLMHALPQCGEDTQARLNQIRSGPPFACVQS
jgi:hypothetical protein